MLGLVVMVQLFAAVNVVAQQRGDERPVHGLPYYFDHFTDDDYGAYPQNWAVVQDHAGIIYVGNTDGVLRFDGAHWSLIPVTNGTTVRSLSVSDDGTVYVGAQGDFGYLLADSTGETSFVSLADRLAESEQGFDDVWGTHAAGGYVFFQTRDRVFRWDGEMFHLFRPAETFRVAFSVRDRYFVRDRGRGLVEAVGDSLVLVRDGELFRDLQLYVMAPLSGNRVVFATREEGLFISSGGAIERFETEADEWLRSNRLYSGISVNENAIVLGTLGGGIAVLDSDGRLLQVIDEGNQLPDGYINYVYADRQGGVWLAFHSRGIARIDVASPLSVFGEYHGFSGLSNYIMRHEDDLYVSTNMGLFRMLTMEEARPRFSPVEGIESSRMTLAHGNGILAAADVGLFFVKNDRVTELAEGLVHSLLHHDKGIIYLATASGIQILDDRDPGQTRLVPVAGISEETMWLMSDDSGRLWAQVRGGLLRVTPPPNNVFDPEGYVVESFDHDDGIPAAEISLTHIAGSLVLVSKDGLYSYAESSDGEKGRFERDSRLSEMAVGGGNTFISIVEDGENRLWIVRPDRVDIFERRTDGSYEPSSPAPLSFPNWKVTQVYVEDDGTAWLSNDHELYRYDPSPLVAKNYDAALPPVINQVTLVETGERLSAELLSPGRGVQLLELSNRNNAVRFDFALPSYNRPAGNRYQFLLEGHDTEWSEWSTTAHKNYMNIFEGTYRFRLRGMNAQGFVSPEAVYTFRVLPPWYRTWWAYAIYLGFFLTLGAFAVHYRRMATAHRRAKIQAEELERERMVNERLQESYRLLQEANESLLQADRLKDEFLANTSHELRTPLTAILGFASILKEEVSGEHQEFTGMIEENGKRLLHTLNSLLDLAKLRVGMMDIDLQAVDVTSQARQVGQLLVPLALKKGLKLDVRTPSSALYARLDPHCFERILYNLVGNAIKFTDEGSVTVVVEATDEEVITTVADTGVG
ncbi:MAG: histidine kinase dimerization/phospho-acceptor domain-containing protein, partial [Rhodothermales bacterium]